MITASGIHIQTIGGIDGTPTARDIAIHAGRICRFGGAVWYPLLPHLVFVGLLALRRSDSWANCIWGFLHDAHEIVTSDIPRPFKCDCLRREQNAIDRRIAGVFIGSQNGNGRIDHDLIKRCDLDACDLEATELKLPHYRAIKATPVYDDAGDRRLLRAILSSPFNRNTIESNSEGVRRFAFVLSLAARREFEAVKESVAGWGLI